MVISYRYYHTLLSTLSNNAFLEGISGIHCFAVLSTASSLPLLWSEYHASCFDGAKQLHSCESLHSQRNQGSEKGSKWRRGEAYCVVHSLICTLCILVKLFVCNHKMLGDSVHFSKGEWTKIITCGVILSLLFLYFLGCSICILCGMDIFWPVGIEYCISNTITR